MLNVNSRSSSVRQPDVPVHADFFAASRASLNAKLITDLPLIKSPGATQLSNLTMTGKEHPKRSRVFHGVLQNCRIGNRVSIVGQHDYTELAHSVDSRKLASCPVLGDAT